MAKSITTTTTARVGVKKVTSIGHSVRSKPNQKKCRVKAKYRGQGK